MGLFENIYNNYYAYPFFICALLIIYLGLIAFLKDKSKSINLWFFITMFFVAIENFLIGAGMMFKENIEYWIYSMAWLFIPEVSVVFTYIFLLVYLHRATTVKLFMLKFGLLAYLSFAFFAVNTGVLYAAPMDTSYGLIYHPGGPLAFAILGGLILPLIVLLVGSGFYYYFSSSTKLQRKKAQIGFLLIVIVVSNTIINAVMLKFDMFPFSIFLSLFIVYLLSRMVINNDIFGLMIFLDEDYPLQYYPDSIVFIDRDFKIKKTNASFLKQFGGDGVNESVFLKLIDGERAIDEFSNKIKLNKAVQIDDLMFITGGGKKIHCSVDVFPQKNIFERGIGYLVLIKDVSDVVSDIDRLLKKNEALKKIKDDLAIQNEIIANSNKILLDREFIMIALKKEIAELKTSAQM